MKKKSPPRITLKKHDRLIAAAVKRTEERMQPQIDRNQILADKSEEHVKLYKELLETTNQERIKFFAKDGITGLYKKLAQAILVGEAFLLAFERYEAGQIDRREIQDFAREFRSAIRLSSASTVDVSPVKEKRALTP